MVVRESRIARNKRLRAGAKQGIQRVKEAEQKGRDEKKRFRNNKIVKKAQAELERKAEKAKTQRIAAKRQASKQRKIKERRQGARPRGRTSMEKSRIRELKKRVYHKITKVNSL